MTSVGHYTVEDVLQILRNVGVNPECGACVCQALTGSNVYQHTCGKTLGEVVITSAEDPVPEAPSVEQLQQKVAFYESVLSRMPPHHYRAGGKCKIAERAGLHCCNPQCNGLWGSGCWCCHHGSDAVGAEPETMQAHLDLLKREEGEAGK